MRLAVIAANFLGWPLLQLGIARAFILMPDRLFQAGSNGGGSGEEEIIFYRRVLHVRRWKNKLPDGGPWVGGQFSKRSLLHRDQGYLRRFIFETRRGEVAHWTMLACTPLFYLWNPLWACLVITLYALASNIPCIIVQRYNRFRLEKIASALD